jgi:hypothetical protein
MNPDRRTGWSYSGPKPPICLNCGVPARIKSANQTADEFVYRCVSCARESKHTLRGPITKDAAASAPSSRR